MNRIKKILLALVCLILVAVILPSTLAGCAKAPEYAEIEERFRALVEASHPINEIFFGEGLPTYERVSEPWENPLVYTEEGVDKNGKPTTLKVYYRYFEDETYGMILAYKDQRQSVINPTYGYLQLLREPDETREAVFVNEEKGNYYYAIEYREQTYDWYYTAQDPANYDYVRLDSPYYSIVDMKNLANQVYSQAYLSSVYGSMFDGIAAVDGADVAGLSPRYKEYTDSEGDTYFMKSNTYEPVTVTKNVFDFSTAKIVRPKNAKKVTIEIRFHPENQPDKWDTMRISMALENGKWMLDSPTY